jgi:hypothetical protein
METNVFDEIVKKQLNACKKVLIRKAQEYATEDRLHNFKIASRLQELTPQQALAGMMAKHTVSIYDMCNSKVCLPMHIWDEKITDHINYLILLKAIVEEYNLEPPGDFTIIDGNGNRIDLDL